MENGIAKAIRLAGSQTALGKLVGLSPQAVQKWAARGFVPGDMCREVEAALYGQVTRYELNPRVFGDPHVATTRRADDPPPPGPDPGADELPSRKNLLEFRIEQPTLYERTK